MSECNRRSFLGILAGACVFGLLDSLHSGTKKTRAARRNTTGVTAFRRSGRGRNVSNAARKHNANHLYATFEAALNDPAHPGDRSRVVPIVIGAGLFHGLFGDGKVSADFRHDLRTSGDYRSLQRCLSGPAGSLEPGCESADRDGNGLVDLREYARLQQSFTGP